MYMICLPNTAMIVLWSFVGPKCLYLKKEFYEHILRKRQLFEKEPITLFYQLERNKERYYLEDNLSLIRGRPSICVEPERKAKINGNIALGRMDKCGQITPSSALIDALIPVAVVDEPVSYNYSYTTLYWNVHCICAADVTRCREYMLLWNKF